jgi:hypothetical protein
MFLSSIVTNVEDWTLLALQEDERGVKVKC